MKTPIGVYQLRDIAQLRVRIQRCLGKSPFGQLTRTGKSRTTTLYTVIEHVINQAREPMVFKPNYGRDRAERSRAARARSEEKQKKKEERTALRKAERAASELPTDDEQS
jgi:hypothetical protein